MPWPTNEGNKINLHLKWQPKLYNNLGVRSHPGVILGPFGSFVLNILVLWSRLAQLLDAVLRHITLCHGLTMSRDVKRSCHSCHSMAPLPMAPSQEGTSALRSSDSDAGDQADLYKRCLHAWCMPGACLVHAWCMPGAKLQDVATGFILVASAKGRFANNHLVPQVQPSQGVAWSRTKTIFNENIYVANGCKWMHMNTFPSIPLHLHYTSLHYIRKNGSESWLHRGAAAHPSPTCPNFHCDLLHESFLGPGSLVYRRRWPWTASSYYVDLCGMVQ